jgi:hypothetical protein
VDDEAPDPAEVDGWINTRRQHLYSTDSFMAVSFGGEAGGLHHGDGEQAGSLQHKTVLLADQHVLASLTLTVAPLPGTHELLFWNASVTTDTGDRRWPPATPFMIAVESP